MEHPNKEAGESFTVSRLRTEATRHLRSAVKSRDPDVCDRLTWKALALLERARTIDADNCQPAPPAEAKPDASHASKMEDASLSIIFSRKHTAEFVGTLWLVLGGCGSAVLAAAFPEVGIGLHGVSLAFGLTVLTMAYAIGHVSGCHLNPAVTVGLVVAGRFEARRAPGYIIAQVAGAVVGALVLYLIASGKAGFDATASGFASNGYGEHSPGGYDFGSAFLTEAVMTAFFLAIILGSTSERAPKGFAPLAIGLGLTLVHLVSIPITNTSVNPARSTGPALFQGGWALAQLWMFWVAPIVGAVAAGFVARWLGVEDNDADREAAVKQARSTPGESLAPATAREPR